MNQAISRREFLKLMGLAALGTVIPPSIRNIEGFVQASDSRKNILIIVFDALSAHNIGLHGYHRDTMPNLAHLSKKAVVFHNHFSSGSFTTPGTASLLTGTHPWTHRAIRLNGMVKKSLAENNIFNLFADYYRTAYSHNPLVNILLKQFSSSIDNYIPQEKLFLFNDSLIRDLFSGDEDTATVAWTRIIKRAEEMNTYSLFSPGIYEKFRDNKIKDAQAGFPYGLPNVYNDNYFTLENGIDWIKDNIPNLPQPFLGYMHFFPPHYPYKPQRDFTNTFTKDNWSPKEKPQDLFTEERNLDFLNRHRAEYDEHILYADSEFARLFSHLESTGILENTWLILTADHGEMFERGIWAHSTPTLYQPVVRVPLMIFEPGKQTREDVFTNSSAIDLLPTLLHITGHPIPNWTEGMVLPPYNLISKASNGIFAMQAKNNDPQLPLTETSIVHVQDNYKLIYYLGYDALGADKERHQLFDIQADPEELTDLSQIKRETASELLNIVKTHLNEANEPYSH